MENRAVDINGASRTDDPITKRTNIRWLLLAVVFFECLIAYFDRVSMSVCGPDIMTHFGLSKVQLGVTWSAFALAYAAMQIPGGFVSQWLGIRRTGLSAMIFWSVFTFLTPLALGFYSLLLIRFLFGFGEGPLFSNNGSFLTRWFNKNEKALSSAIMLCGAFLGPALAPPLTVWILSSWGWQMVFYVYGFAGVAIAIIWYASMREFPYLHPKCNRQEVEYISEAGELEKPVKATAKVWKKFLTSTQFWALGLSYFITGYIFWVFLTWLPIYLLEARHLSLKAMGLASTYPFFALCAGMIISGKLSDYFVKRGFRKTIARTTLASVGLAVCGIGLYLGSNADLAWHAIFWMTISLGFLGLTFAVTWAMCQDLGRKQAVQAVGWINTWSNTSAILAPTITAMMVQAFGWQTTLSISAGLGIVGVFVCFAIRPDYPLHD